MQAPKPKWTEASIYKLYVCPVTTFDKTSLKGIFSQYAEVVDLYISDPKENGYRWAFVYFATEEGLEETIRRFEENNVHNFRMSRAKPKTFPPQGAVSPNTSFGAKMLNGIAKTNEVSYTAPPNCVHCRKLTFQQCVSCKNPFCSKECTLDGWRSHTSSCVKVAELIKISEPNGVQGNALAATVVNYMKDCKSSKKKFTSDEFADVCNYRGLVTVSPSVPKEEATTSNEYDNLPIPDKLHDKGRRYATSAQEAPQPALDEDEDPWASSAEKHSPQTPFKKNIKRNVAPPRKQNQKYVSDLEDVEKKAKENPFPDSQPKKYSHPHCTDNEKFIAQNGHRSEEKHVDFKKKLSNEFKRPVKSKETRINTSVPEVDLKLKSGNALSVIVGSIANANTFYVANPEKILQVLTLIHDLAADSRGLKKVNVDEHCLAHFEGDWYRARVLTTNPIQVEYFDYGNKETCNIADLKEFPPLLHKYLPLATKVQLKDGNVSQHNIKENEEIEIYVVEFDPQNNAWIIDVL